MAVALNHRLAYGGARKVEWEKEVVVITGGARGLGRVIVEILVRRGVKVGVLDVVGVEEDVEGQELCEQFDVVWEKCDVGDRKAVEGAVGRISEELGSPTILILNAASPISAPPLLPSLTFTSRPPSSPSPSSLANINGLQPNLAPTHANRTFQTNTLSHFNLLHSLLPSLLSHTQTSQGNGATIVTISSILAHLHPAYLADYAASKAAASSLHLSLTHEILSHHDPNIRSKVKTLLVETGHIDTQLFSSMDLPKWTQVFAPTLDSNVVARNIVDSIGSGKSGVLRMPFYAKIVGGPLWHMIPGSVMRAVRWASNIDAAMGRGVDDGGRREGGTEKKGQ